MYKSTQVYISDIKDQKVFYTIHDDDQTSIKYSIQLSLILEHESFNFSEHKINNYSDIQNAEIFSNLRKKITKIIRENAVDIIESYVELYMNEFDKFDSELDFLDYINDLIGDNSQLEEFYIKFPNLTPFVFDCIQNLLTNDKYLISSRIFFNYFIDRSELGIDEIATKIKMNTATLERKIKHNYSFTREEMILISKVLKLSGNEFLTLFRD